MERRRVLSLIDPLRPFVTDGFREANIIVHAREQRGFVITSAQQ